MKKLFKHASQLVASKNKGATLYMLDDYDYAQLKEVLTHCVIVRTNTNSNFEREVADFVEIKCFDKIKIWVMFEAISRAVDLEKGNNYWKCPFF